MHHKLITIFSIAFFAVSTHPLPADELDTCINEKVSEFEAAVSFSHPASVTCPSADIVGFPPKERKHDRSTVVTYKPPSSFSIRTDSADKPTTVRSISQNAGWISSPEINEAQITVSIGCSGRPLGKGRAWQEIRIEGEIFRRPSVDQVKNWILQCAKELS